MSAWSAWSALAAHLPRPPQPPGERRGAVQDACIVAGFCTLLALLVRIGDGYHAFFDALNAPWARVPDALAQTITYAGDTLPALALMLLAARWRPGVVWLGTLAALVASLLSNALKLLVSAMRPAAVLPAASFHLVGPAYHAHSFPSGHSITAFATAATLGWWLPRGGRIALYLVAAAIAWSRVGVGAHWPLDALGGAAIGCAAVLIAARVAQRWSWGERARGHSVLLLALATCAVWLVLRAPVYPLAAWPARTLGVLALAEFGWGWRQNLRRPSQPTAT